MYSHKIIVGMAATTLIAGYAAAQQLSPVRELTGYAEASVGGPGYLEIAPSGANFRTAALVDVYTDSDGRATKVDRRVNNNTSATYAGVSLPLGTPTPLPAVTGAPATADVFKFKQSGDSAQGWATMTSTGMPFLQLQAFGKATASGTATWTATVMAPAQPANIYVQFRLPQVLVTGTTEEDGPALWQSRFRADLLLNGHPVWSTGAVRMNELMDTPVVACPTNGIEDAAVFLANYGSNLGLSASDKTVESAAQQVTLSLGSFPSGQGLDLSLVVRSDADSSRACCLKASQLFCTGASTVVEWDNTAAPVHFWAGPAL